MGLTDFIGKKSDTKKTSSKNIGDLFVVPKIEKSNSSIVNSDLSL
jgi:hypothetical protein